MPLDLKFVKLRERVFRGHLVEGVKTAGVARFVERLVINPLPVLQAHAVDVSIQVNGPPVQRSDRIGAESLVERENEGGDQRLVGGAGRRRADFLQRVDPGRKFFRIFGLAVVEQRHVGSGKIETRHRDHHVVNVEITAFQRIIFHPLVVAHLFVHLAVIQRGQ